jgi:hypothetical protein
MTDDDRFKLLFGPYRTPVFKYGDDAFCELRGDVILCGLTDAPIPWPTGKKRQKARGRGAIVVYGALAEAVRRESAQAVAFWFGVTAQTVTRWRKAPDVGPVNEGTHRLRHDYAEEPWAAQARAKAHAKAGDPARCAKIAATKRGKPRPAHVGAAVAAAHRGTERSAEARRKMSEVHRLRGTRPPKVGTPWTEQEDELVRTLPAKEVAKRTGRTPVAVWARRRVLQLPDGRTRAARAGARRGAVWARVSCLETLSTTCLNPVHPAPG